MVTRVLQVVTGMFLIGCDGISGGCEGLTRWLIWWSHQVVAKMLAVGCYVIPGGC